MFWEFIGREFGGEGGIRTHVEALAPHPISSRCRYGHFGTSPAAVIISLPAYYLPELFNSGGVRSTGIVLEG